MPATDDEIREKYLERAIRELNHFTRELQTCDRCPRGNLMPVLGSGHPQADIVLCKYAPTPAEIEEGVAFYGRAGQAVLKSLERLKVDPLSVYGTNCLKFAGQRVAQACSFLTRELHIVQPKLVVAMGEDTLRFVNELRFPLADEVEARPGELQRFTPTIDALVVPDIDASLDEQAKKTEFWNALKALGPWWAELPPY